MELALIGYGKMGREVEKAAVQRGHSIGARIDNELDWLSQAEKLTACQAAIEFSAPRVARENILKCFEKGIPVISGTTGWYDYLPEVLEACEKLQGTLFYSSNFSIGVNMFFEINRRLAVMMEKYPGYDVKIGEIHHLQKLDAPSGTAVTLANDIIHSVNRKHNWVNQPSEFTDQLEISSLREGTVTGLHTVCWSSDIDSITLKHEARNRQGFAQGALLAAEFVTGKKGIYGMKDLLGF